MAWGTTYIVSTELLPADRPLLAGLLRALPAGVGLALITRSRPTGSWWLKAAVLGTLRWVVGAWFGWGASGPGGRCQPGAGSGSDRIVLSVAVIC